jgi:hypothetical protein
MNPNARKTPLDMLLRSIAGLADQAALKSFQSWIPFLSEADEWDCERVVIESQHKPGPVQTAVLRLLARAPYPLLVQPEGIVTLVLADEDQVELGDFSQAIQLLRRHFPTAEIGAQILSFGVDPEAMEVVLVTGTNRLPSRTS